MGLMVTVQGVGQFLGTFLVQMLLGPSLDHWFLAGGVLMGLGLAGTILLASAACASTSLREAGQNRFHTSRTMV